METVVLTRLGRGGRAGLVKLPGGAAPDHHRKELHYELKGTR